MSEYKIGETVPVKVFRSTDPGAPKMEAGVKLKTILKACLITGYGEIGTPERKEPVGGWEITAESEEGAVFKPTDVRCGGYALNVAEYSNENGNATVGMTNTPETVHRLYYNIKPGGIHFPYRYPDENYRNKSGWSGVRKNEWLVVAHDTGVFFSFDTRAYESARGGFYFSRVQDKVTGAFNMLFIGTSYTDINRNLNSRNALYISFSSPVYTGGTAKIASPFSYNNNFPDAQYKFGTYFTPEKPLAAPLTLTASDGYFLTHLPGLMAANSRFSDFLTGEINGQKYIIGFLDAHFYVGIDTWQI